MTVLILRRGQSRAAKTGQSSFISSRISKLTCFRFMHSPQSSSAYYVPYFMEVLMKYPFRDTVSKNAVVFSLTNWAKQETSQGHTIFS